MPTGRISVGDKAIEVKDLRQPSHHEYGDQVFAEIKKHVHTAIAQNGIRTYDKSIYDFINRQVNDLTKIGLAEHAYQLAGQAKGILKHRYKFGTSTFNRYQHHHYETLDLLKRKGIYKIDNEIYWTTSGTARLELIQSVNELCQGIEKPTVLEAGCGSGLNMYLLNCLNENLKISGFEYTNARLASAIVNLFNSPLRPELFLADICDLKLPDNSIDVMYTNHVMEQLGQTHAEIALKEIWRVCRKGIVVCEPSIHGANLYERWRMKTLGYCEDLQKVAKSLPNSKIIRYEEDKIRYYPNTSNHLVVEKI